MIFTSYTYLVFLVLACLCHWLAPIRLRNAILIGLSYWFYCSWQWQYGFLLLGVSLFTYYYGAWLTRRPSDGRLLAVGIGIELLPLIYFKYSEFLLVSGAGALRGLGVHIAPPVLDIALPLGISFFTFQGIAYLVHVAAGETPFRRATDFLLFKAFWPQLIAGPIIRPGEIEAQITGTRTLSYPDVAAGLQRIAHGCFKKVVLADLLAPYVDAAFLPGANPAAIDCAAGMLGFGLQIYFDFSGYSDIAIGSARLFGFTFPENFDWPYAARSPQEFWNRWHMTLSRWIRDYLFTPLSFAARRHPRVAHIWLLLAMALCGLWHGAEWTFVLWGLWHGALLVLGQTWLKGLFRLSPGDGFRAGLVNAGRCGLTFGLVTLGWLLFRSQSVAQVGDMLHALLTLRGGLRPAVLRENALMIIGAVFLGSLAARWLASSRIVGLATGNARWASAARGLYYALLVIATVIFDREARAFVYFQF